MVTINELKNDYFQQNRNNWSSRSILSNCTLLANSWSMTDHEDLNIYQFMNSRLIDGRAPKRWGIGGRTASPDVGPRAGRPPARLLAMPHHASCPAHRTRSLQSAHAHTHNEREAPWDIWALAWWVQRHTHARTHTTHTHTEREQRAESREQRDSGIGFPWPWRRCVMGSEGEREHREMYGG